jgi:hypothetical protein
MDVLHFHAWLNPAYSGRLNREDRSSVVAQSNVRNEVTIEEMAVKAAANAQECIQVIGAASGMSEEHKRRTRRI